MRRQIHRWLYTNLLGVLATSVSAQTFVADTDGQFGRFEGRIQFGSEERFRRFLDENPDLVGLSLSSPGGNVHASLEIARELHARRLSTYVPRDAICASACANVFFAGYDRLVHGRLGVHQMSAATPIGMSAVQFTLAEILDAYELFEVPFAASQKMLRTVASDMYWFAEFELNDYGINRDLPGDANDFRRLAVRPDKDTVQFSDFPVERYEGPIALPDFSGRHSDYRSYRTRIKEGALAGANFAGHLALLEIGCGTSCRFVVTVDVRTGEPGDFPYGGEDNYGMQLLFIPESRMIKVVWLDIPSSTCIEQKLVLENVDYRVIDEKRTKTDGYYCGSIT